VTVKTYGTTTYGDGTYGGPSPDNAYGSLTYGSGNYGSPSDVDVSLMGGGGPAQLVRSTGTAGSVQGFRADGELAGARLAAGLPFLAGLQAQDGVAQQAQNFVAQTVAQSTRFNNTQTFFNGSVTTTSDVAQAVRFDNAQTFFGGVVTGLNTVDQGARFDNAQTFYGGAVIQPGGLQTVTQNTRFDNAQIFYGGTVTQPVPPPAPQVAGGSGGTAPRRRKRPEWENWRAQERARLESLLRGEDTTPEVQQAAATLSTSAEPRAQRIARKLTNYTGGLDQLKSLQRDIAKLEVDIQQRRIADENYQALQQAAAELSAVMQDDGDFLATYAEYEKQEAELLFAALGGSLLL
jgi:hypothetical protein